MFRTISDNIADFRDKQALKLVELVDNMVKLPVLLKEKIEEVFQDMIKNVLLLPLRLKDIYDIIIEKAKSIIDGILELPTKIGDAIKGLFVPSDGFFETKIEHFRKKLLGMGIDTYDMGSIFSEGKPFDDITCTIMGQEVTIIKMDVVEKVVLKFRPVIRGFMWLMMVFYNFNQFMGFIGQDGVTLGGIIKTASTDSERD